ncbi:cointegrate resolution protein [Verticiella sediminum]|uniref:Cointegrate resolution protein n=1 Tax=Verticiella sediminum TaxID=1247510 RepID=A0A556AYA8_9BURK|nr:DNA-binding protein [Verticiella sediminum]TSH97902.1 cointegrate resolution protein [Verticiella sediminum]
MATGIQQQDVWMAADALLRAGEQPTIERVRLYLGRGSPNTVGPHLKAWFGTLGMRLDGAGGSQLPESVERAAYALWEAATEQAGARAAAHLADREAALHEARAAFDRDREALQRERERLGAREADLTHTMQAANAHAAAAQESERAARQDAARLRDQLSAEREESSRLAQALELAEGQVKEALSSHQRDLAAAQARHAAHERRWLADIDHARTSARRLEQQLTLARKALGEAEQRIAGLAAELERVRGESGRAEAAAQARLEHANHQHALLQTRLDELAQSQRDMQARADAEGLALRQQCAALQARVDTLGAHLQDKEQQLTLLVQALARHAPPPPAPENEQNA